MSKSWKNYNVINYDQLLAEATDAANAAGDKWMAEALERGPKYSVHDGFTNEQVGTMLDVCGFAHVQFEDRRTRFAKWCKEQEGGRRCYSVPIRHKYALRQELGLKEACARAALKVLESYGIKGLRFWSRID